MRHQVTIGEELWKELEELGKLEERTPANIARWFIRKQINYAKKAAKKAASNQVIQAVDQCPEYEQTLKEQIEIVNNPEAQWVKKINP